MKSAESGENPTGSLPETSKSPSPKKKRANSRDKNLNSKIWAGFYKKTLGERLD